ncbi:hypothetical protein [Nocardia wallacei]|uniref:hypothetical protein n=1 Tax=Nocardia wallacei TaxID=480035 RepID=UPI00245774D5|nr:hypothetical protein [Nocardia wallacei]
MMSTTRAGWALVLGACAVVAIGGCSVAAPVQAAVGQGVVPTLKLSGPAAPSWRKGERYIKGRGPRATYG